MTTWMWILACTWAGLAGFTAGLAVAYAAARRALRDVLEELDVREVTANYSVDSGRDRD